MSINYKNSKVYKIWSPQGDKIYIGSTTKELLCQRMSSHRKEYRKWQNTTKKFISSYLLFEEYGIENCFIELIEAKECSSKDESNKLEGKYIRLFDCVNKRIEGRTKQEYSFDNKEHIFNYKKQYREDHKEEIKFKKSTSYICECGSTFTDHHRARHERSIKHKSFIDNLSKQ
jgi:hypothetical protein